MKKLILSLAAAAIVHPALVPTRRTNLISRRTIFWQ